jgi:hypothetical protein
MTTSQIECKRQVEEQMARNQTLYGGCLDKVLVEVEESWTVGKITVTVKGWRLKDNVQS